MHTLVGCVCLLLQLFLLSNDDLIVSESSLALSCDHGGVESDSIGSSDTAMGMEVRVFMDLLVAVKKVFQLEHKLTFDKKLRLDGRSND